MLSIEEIQMFEEIQKELMMITTDDVEALANGEDVDVGDFVIRATDDPDDDSIHTMVTIDVEEDVEDDEINESLLIERRVRQTTKMGNSNKVVQQTTKELFGPEGKYRSQVRKIFAIFKKEIKKNAKEMNVPVNQVRSWKITLRDYDDNKQGKKLSR